MPKPYPRAAYDDGFYDHWRKSVFQRDNYTCQVCHARGKSLEAHHIKSWANHYNLRYEVANGITVCKGKCHKSQDTITREREKNYG